MLCVIAAGKQKDIDNGKYLETRQIFFPLKDAIICIYPGKMP